MKTIQTIQTENLRLSGEVHCRVCLTLKLERLISIVVPVAKQVLEGCQVEESMQGINSDFHIRRFLGELPQGKRP